MQQCSHFALVCLIPSCILVPISPGSSPGLHKFCHIMYYCCEQSCLRTQSVISYYTTTTESPMLDRVNYMRLVTFRSSSMSVCHIACSPRCVSTHLAPLFPCWPVPPLGEYSAVRKMRMNPWYGIWSPPSLTLSTIPFPLVLNHIGWADTCMYTHTDAYGQNVFCAVG